MSHQKSPLAPALASLATSTALLSSTLSILDTGTTDLQRLRTVLSQTRHFELLPTSSLAAAQSAVIDELTPEIESLLSKAESVVERRERREEWLRARWALGEGRLGRDPDLATKAEIRNSSTSTLGTKQFEEERTQAPSIDDSKVKRLRQKKERLSYAVDRLTLQANQRERQLRMSMAAQEQRVSSESAYGAS